MKFQILDVEHGFCAYVVADNGNLMLFDCGHNSSTSFRPSSYLYQNGFRTIHRLFISNYDEDHISDLPRLRSTLNISILHRNTSVSVQELRNLKQASGRISEAMNSLLDMMNTYTGGVSSSPPAFPNIDWYCYWNRYPEDFVDTNNISLVTFLNFGGLEFILPGDLEKAGWECLLKLPDFRDRLSKVQIFIASHHGRESGYCREVFNYCRPSFIVISDGQKQYATQEMVNTYGNHAQGVLHNGETRKVLTTRCDGSLTWER